MARRRGLGFLKLQFNGLTGPHLSGLIRRVSSLSVGRPATQAGSWAGEWAVPGSRPPGRRPLQGIQAARGGRGPAPTRGWPGGWQKSSPLTPNNHSRHQQLNRYHPRRSRPATRGDLGDRYLAAKNRVIHYSIRACSANPKMPLRAQTRRSALVVGIGNHPHGLYLPHRQRLAGWRLT